MTIPPVAPGLTRGPFSLSMAPGLAPGSDSNALELLQLLNGV